MPIRKGNSSIQKAAAAFNVSLSTLIIRVHGMSTRKNTIANSWKLSDKEESTLSVWILDID